MDGANVETPVPKGPTAAVSSSEKAWTLLAFTLFTAIPLSGGAKGEVMTAIAVALSLWGWWRRYRSTMVISTFAALCGLCNVGGLNFPQLAFVVSLGAVAVLAYKADWLTGAFSWLQRGHHVGRAVPLSLAAVALTAVGLVSWHSILKPDNSTIYTQFGFLSLPLPVLVSGAIAFALLNAAIEEAVYRGLLMDALNEQFPLPVAVGLQASAFGMLHMLGFPGGAIGIVLATVYGAMMAAVRLYSGGMLAPWAAHVTADLTIFTILLVALHR